MQCVYNAFALSLLPLFLTVKLVHAYDTPQFPVASACLKANLPATIGGTG